MALKISKEVESLVLQDRQDGMSVRAITEKYEAHGVTKKWVERVTKDVAKPESQPQQAAKKVFPLATSPIGVKQSECYNIYMQVYGTVWDEENNVYVLNITQEQKDYIKHLVKERAKKEGKQALFLPDWMDRSNPLVCNQLMLEAAQNLNDALTEQVEYFRTLFPEANTYSVVHEMLSLAFRGYNPESVESRCNRNVTCAQALDDYANQDIPPPSRATVQSYKDQWERQAKEYAPPPAMSEEEKQLRRERVSSLIAPVFPEGYVMDATEDFNELIEAIGL